MSTTDRKSETELKTRNAIAREAFNKKKNPLCSSMDKEIRNNLVKYYSMDFTTRSTDVTRNFGNRD